MLRGARGSVDIVAGKVAEALFASKLVLLTNTPGILDAEQNTLSGLSKADVKSLISEGIINSSFHGISVNVIAINHIIDIVNTFLTSQTRNSRGLCRPYRVLVQTQSRL